MSEEKGPGPTGDQPSSELPRHSRRATARNAPSLRPPQAGRTADPLRVVAEGLAAIAAPVATSVDEVLSRIATVAMELTGATYCALGIGTDPSQQFEPWVFIGMSDEQARDIGRSPRPVCLLGAVPHEGHTIRLAQMQKDPHYCGFPPHHPEMHAFLGVPIRLNERSIGNLYLTEKQGGFTAEDQLIVETLAVHAGVAVESARLFEEARQRTAQLEEERQQRETFISVVSHELRGPISVLMGYSDLLPMWDRLPPERRQMALRAIGDQARLMNRLIGDLLDTSRIQTGRFVIDEGPTDLAEIARSVVAAQQAAAPKRTIDLEAPAHLHFMADGSRLSQAITNLLSNALKYSPEDSAVTVKVSREGNNAHVSVTDRGVGIPPDQMGDLFQAYSRLARGSQIAKGIGLGLFITRGIIQAHGGRIWVESEGQGKGTTFHFTVPMGS